MDTEETRLRAYLLELEDKKTKLKEKLELEIQKIEYVQDFVNEKINENNEKMQQQKQQPQRQPPEEQQERQKNTERQLELGQQGPVGSGGAGLALEEVRGSGGAPITAPRRGRPPKTAVAL